MTDLERHGIPPSVDVDGWELRVSGAVDEALSFTERDLAALPMEMFTGDFACTEGWVAEDLSWRGVRVRTILERAGTTAESDHALVHAMDGDYACSFPLDRLAGSILAVELDGAPLPVEHGGPARLVPTDADRDCWESIKWVEEFEVTTSPRSKADTARGLALSRIE